MKDTQLDSGFADAVRSELIAIGTRSSLLQRHQRRVRLAVAGVVAAGIALGTTGAALVITGIPGTTTVTALGDALVVTRTGTSTIELGPAAAGATSVIIDVTCASRSGAISVPSTNGFSQDASGTVTPSVGTTDWDCAVRSTTVRIRDGYLAPGTTSITVTADPGTTWTAKIQYASSTTSPFGINAHGQTFGADNSVNGEPDLQGAQATNGKVGYIVSKDFRAFHGCGYLPVYESDGTTVIGEFSIGMDENGVSQCITASPTPTAVAPAP